jgi:hypothetical protein
MVAIAGFNKEQILGAVRQMYTEVANLPSKQFHFPTGRSACLFVGYPEDWLDATDHSESFARVGFRSVQDHLGTSVLTWRRGEHRHAHSRTMVGPGARCSPWT